MSLLHVAKMLHVFRLPHLLACLCLLQLLESKLDELDRQQELTAQELQQGTVGKSPGKPAWCTMLSQCCPCHRVFVACLLPIHKAGMCSALNSLHGVLHVLL